MQSLQDDRDSTFIIVTSFLAGLATTALLPAFLMQPPPTATQMLKGVMDNQGAYALYGVLITTWMVLSVPFLLSVGKMLKAKSSAAAQAAVVLSVGDILMLGYSSYAVIATLLSIAAILLRTEKTAASIAIPKVATTKNE